MRCRHLLFLVFVATALRAQQSEPAWRTNWAQALEAARNEHRMILVDRDERGNFAREPVQFNQLTDVIFLQLGGDSSFFQDSAGRPNPVGAPSYLLYDPDGRERFRVAKTALTNESIEKIRVGIPAFLKAAELLDAHHDLQASFLLGNTYNRLRMPSQARSSYGDAAKLALKGGDNAAAQLAEVQSAFTFTYDGDPARAITLLKELTTKAVNRDNEAIIWLTLGKAHEASRDTKSALEAFSRAQSLAAPGGRTFAEAGKAIARLQ